MPRECLSIAMPEGQCPAHVFTPDEASGKRTEGSWPAVIFYMDGVGIRPALLDMAQRLADGGYVVLLPDLFWRHGPYGPFDPKQLLSSPERANIFATLIASAGTKRVTEDSAEFLKAIDARSDVKGGKVGTTGYCMGGAISLTVAGTYPDRIAAAASFHGGSLATDAPDSPHLLAPKIKAKLYIGEADNDPYYPPEMGKRLGAALDAAGTGHDRVLYEGAFHGWTMTDFEIYDRDAANRHWDALFKLYGETLG